ncbi:hypothetical protein BS47DRAFT_1355263, partial [Hydnum rufescens UP504]
MPSLCMTVKALMVYRRPRRTLIVIGSIMLNTPVERISAVVIPVATTVLPITLARVVAWHCPLPLIQPPCIPGVKPHVHDNLNYYMTVSLALAIREEPFAIGSRDATLLA